MIALVRSPSTALAGCELTYLERVPIDIALAERQHTAYCDALRAAGATIVEVPPAPDLPDAVFVEDTAVILDEVAVLARPGAESRRAEVDAVREVLGRYRKLAAVPPPGTLDGGDVLRVGRRLFVGRTERTNAAGIGALTKLAEPLGYTVTAVPVNGCLHLLSACSDVADGVVLVNRDWIDASLLSECRLVDVPGEEPGAANTVRVGDTVLMSAAFPRTRDLLEGEGLDVRPLEVSEFEKAEGGVSCLALLIA